MKARASIEIDRPVEVVFAFVTDVASMPAWMSGVTAAHMISERIGPGARFVLAYTEGWRPYDLEVEVVEFEVNRSIGLKTARGSFSFDGRMEMETVDGKARVSSIIEAGPDSVATELASKLLGPFIRPTMARRLLRELEALAAVIEGDPSVTR